MHRVSASHHPSPEWEHESKQLWSKLDEYEPEQFVAEVEKLIGNLSAGHPIALFERACAQDSTGHSDRAVPLYREALERGLVGLRRRRATIQLASSLRNVGQSHESVRLLSKELEGPDDELSGAVRGFLALALADIGREREGLMHGLSALASYLPRYNRSMSNYAAELLKSEEKKTNAP